MDFPNRMTRNGLKYKEKLRIFEESEFVWPLTHDKLFMSYVNSSINITEVTKSTTNLDSNRNVILQSSYFDEENQSKKNPSLSKSPKKSTTKPAVENGDKKSTNDKISDESQMETNQSEAPKTPAEKKKFNYYKYKAKLDSGPKNPGSKPVPVGAENCLEGITFVLTGTGDSMGRDETKQLIERYAGKVTSAVSGKTGYLVVGDDAGESKIAKVK